MRPFPKFDGIVYTRRQLRFHPQCYVLGKTPHLLLVQRVHMFRVLAFPDFSPHIHLPHWVVDDDTFIATDFRHRNARTCSSLCGPLCFPYVSVHLADRP